MQEPMNERLMQVYKELKKTGLVTSKTAFMESIGQLKQHFAGFESGTRKVHPKHITQLVNQFGVNPDYMLSGKPPVLREAKAAGQSISAGRDMSGVNQAGGNISTGNEAALRAELDRAMERIRDLEERLKDKDQTIATKDQALATKEQLIALLMKQQG